MSDNQRIVFTLMVDNEFGVLTRITALIRRAGWNICSLAVAETARHEVSRLTICLECRHHTLEHVLERLGKLDCVLEITMFESETQVAQELALVRVKTTDEALLAGILIGCGRKVLNQNSGETLVAVVGEPAKLDDVLKRLQEIGVADLARTGTIALKLPEREGDSE